MGSPLFFREEFFGSLIYNTYDKEYYFFDEESTWAIKEILDHLDNSKKLDEELKEFKEELEQNHLFLDETVFIKNKNRKAHFSAPLRVFLDITHLCNLQCKHCFTESGKRRPEEITTEHIFKLVDQMREAGTFLLSIAGGEPLLRKDLVEVIEYAKSQYIDISFTTNGLKINEEWAKKLDALGLRTITVSIDGMEESHDTIRGKGNFRKAVENIKILRKFCRSAKISIKNTVNALNLDEYKELIGLAEELEVDAIKFNPIRLCGRTWASQNLMINQSQYITFLKSAQKVKAKVRVSIPKTPLDNVEYEFVPVGFGCTGGKETCNISPTGEFSACAFLGAKYVVGNIQTDNFLEMWEKANQTVEYTGNETCLSCSEYKNCRGGCRARALFESGDVNGVDPLCVLEKGGVALCH